MMVYLFRRKAESAKALGFCEIGLAVVNEAADLFWTLDEFGNPYDFEVSLARPGDVLHAWQRDYSKIVAAEMKTKTAPGTCFFTDETPRIDRDSTATISDTLMDQTEREWSSFNQDGLV
jgi:hypothetical protein